MRRLGLGVILCAALATLGMTGTDTGSVRAALNDQTIDLDQVSRYHCHDLEYPTLRCYRTAAELDQAIASAAMDSGGESELAVLAVSYVRIYVDASYGGGSMVISYPYDRLGDIGWNDRVSSFKTLNNGGGRFWQHIYGEGWSYGFCCFTNVTWVGSAYNDKFSSVYPN